MLETLSAPFAAVAALMAAGGPFVLWIFAAGALMWAVILERYFFFKWSYPTLAREMIARWTGRQDHQSWAAQQIRRKLISSINGEMDSNMQVMKVLVPLCPLLGLIGTVHGMLEVFDSMSILGTADARSMASGVSKAMNCTMTGLAVSITGMFPLFHFQGRIRRQTAYLSEQFKY